MTGQMPQTRRGGLLVLSVELTRDGEPVEVQNLGSHLSATATLAGEAVHLTPVLGEQTYPAAWQSWRLEVGPERAGKALAVTAMVSGLPDGELRWSAHFIPRDAGR